MKRAHPPAINFRAYPPFLAAAFFIVFHILIGVSGRWWPEPLQQMFFLRPFAYTDGVEWLSVLGHALVHTSWDHLLFNMLFLVLFASVVRTETGFHESVWLVTFVVGVVASAIGQWMWWGFADSVLGQETAFRFAVGASGGVSALFAAAVVLRGGWGKARLAGTIWLALQLVAALIMPQIAWAGHVAGYLAGMAIMTRVRT